MKSTSGIDEPHEHMDRGDFQWSGQWQIMGMGRNPAPLVNIKIARIYGFPSS